MPVLDMVDSVGPCRDALTSQSLPSGEFEVIVVANGSTDGTPDVVRRYPVRLLHEPAAGRAMRATDASRALAAAGLTPLWMKGIWLAHAVADTSALLRAQRRRRQRTSATSPQGRPSAARLARLLQRANWRFAYTTFLAGRLNARLGDERS